MTQVDLIQALNAIEPSTKAAKLREVMPVIEQKIAEGVRIADILKTLNGSGIDITATTLKSYLYRHREKQRQKKPTRRTPPDQPKEHESETPEAVPTTTIDRLMNPDPAEQAAEMAEYERIAKHNRRNRK